MPIRRRLYSAARRGQSPPQSRLIFASCGQSPAVVHAVARPASVRPSRILKGPLRIDVAGAPLFDARRRRPLFAAVRRTSRLHFALRIGAIRAEPSPTSADRRPAHLRGFILRHGSAPCRPPRRAIPDLRGSAPCRPMHRAIFSPPAVLILPSLSQLSSSGAVVAD